LYCGEGTIVKKSGDGHKIATLRCRSWGCPDCAPRRRRELIALARSGRPNTFITLTVASGIKGEPWELAQRLAKAWRTIVARAKRRYRYERIDYFAVFEATKKGLPHLHILARCAWIDQRWLSEQMNELLGSPIVDIRRIDGEGRSASYIAKYVGKSSHRFGKSKRYWCTQKYEHGKELRPWVHRIWTRHNSGWEISRLNLNDWTKIATRNGWHVEREGDRMETWFHGPPKREEVPF
jgi:hypothetical protein